MPSFSQLTQIARNEPCVVILNDDEIRAFRIIRRNDDGTKAQIKFLGESVNDN
jgi:hypothetical protein